MNAPAASYGKIGQCIMNRKNAGKLKFEKATKCILE